MKLKGLVWFFTILLIILSVWQLSYTWVVRSHESSVKAQATKLVKKLSPDLQGADLENVIDTKTQHILDSTKNKSIYPILGTSYKDSKDKELNLGLDLQGGISVTLDVSLEGLLKSLSNDSKNPVLLKALAEASNRKATSNENYINIFAKVFAEQNGTGKLSSYFAGPGKSIKISDNDDDVIKKITDVSAGAIDETYKVLSKRIVGLGLASPSINLDKNKGIINVELAGAKDPERVRKLLQAAAHLQFWELYQNKDANFVEAFKNADKALDVYKNSLDSNHSKKDTNSLFRILYPSQTQQTKDGGSYTPAEIGRILVKDTSLLNQYMNLDVVKNSFPSDAKFIYGVEEKADKGQGVLAVYAAKMQSGTDKAPLEGEAVEEAKQDFDERGNPAIKMQMNTLGSKTWARLTGKNVGRPIAIALDDIVYSAPNVNGAIDGGNSEISGSFTIEQAQDLANTLKSGKLNAPAKVVAEQIIGPTLGAASVKGGLMSFGIAFLIIFALMLLYYNTAGWVANIALILNLLFTIGILTMWGLTLTAAGIAGLVLTIGMAVDTNVIIFERIKDELTKGKTYQDAVNAGYKRSLAPILDAHVTTFLTAAILFYFGLGPVLGFATTQMLGIVLSLFCGILVSRLITDFWTNKQRHFNYFTKISKSILKNTNFKFIEYRKVAYIISAIVLVLGIASFFNGFHEGVEFKGGRSYSVKFDKSVKNDDIRNDLKDAFAGDYPIIKAIGTDGKTLDITTSYLIGKENADSAVQTKLYEGLKKALPASLSYTDFVKNKYIQSSSTVQPSISDDLKKGAIKATIFAIFAIFIYILIRFRDWRYSAGTIVALLHDVLVTLIVFSFFKNIVPFPLEIDQHFIAAVLTVIGFSMNDTVIVFDRIREYSRGNRIEDKGKIINRAINDTLSRTIMTSLTVFLVLLTLFIFGGEVTRGFAFAMLIGVITGTYSSIFVAAPILVDMGGDRPLGEPEPVVVVDKKP